MNKTYNKLFIGLVIVGILTGCGSKDVGFDGSSTSKSNQSESTDSKIDQIPGDEQVVDTQMSSDSTNDSLSSSANSILSSGINSTQSDINGEVITLNSVHFSFDKFTLSDSMREIATSNATKIDTTIQSYANLKIKLEGNCDEWGTDEYNYALGLKRAKTAKDALIADGVSENKIMMVSFGESNPICSDRNVKCWKLNRRVDYRLLP